MKQSWVLLCLLFIGFYTSANENDSIYNSESASSSTDWRTGRFSHRSDEILLSFGLHGGMSFGEDIGTTNPFFAGINFELERILNKRWGIGLKIAPSFYIGASGDTKNYTDPTYIPPTPPVGQLPIILEPFHETYNYSNFYSIPIYFTAKYYFATSYVRPYLGLDIGLNVLLGNIDGAQFLNVDGGKMPVYATFGVSPRFGILFDITEKMRFAFDLYANYSTGAEIEGQTISKVEVITIQGEPQYKPVWTQSTKTLSPAISAGAQIRLAISF